MLALVFVVGVSLSYDKPVYAYFWMRKDGVYHLLEHARQEVWKKFGKHFDYTLTMECENGEVTHCDTTMFFLPKEVKDCQLRHYYDPEVCRELYLAGEVVRILKNKINKNKFLRVDIQYNTETDDKPYYNVSNK
jgi:hypothetical protein